MHLKCLPLDVATSFGDSSECNAAGPDSQHAQATGGPNLVLPAGTGRCTPGAPHDEEVGVEDVAVVPLDEPGPQALGPTLGAPLRAGLRVGVRHAGQKGRVLPRHEGKGDAADLRQGSLSTWLRACGEGRVCLDCRACASWSSRSAVATSSIAQGWVAACQVQKMLIRHSGRAQMLSAADLLSLPQSAGLGELASGLTTVLKVV